MVKIHNFDYFKSENVHENIDIEHFEEGQLFSHKGIFYKKVSNGARKVRKIDYNKPIIFGTHRFNINNKKDIFKVKSKRNIAIIKLTEFDEDLIFSTEVKITKDNIKKVHAFLKIIEG